MTHIKNFKQALIKGEVVFILTKVSKGGMQRSFKVLYYHKKQFNTIPLDIDKSVGDGLDKSGDIKIKGCGMDMSFALWLEIVRYFKLNYQELGQNFKAYISFEEFMQCNSHMQEVVNLNNEVAL